MRPIEHIQLTPRERLYQLALEDYKAAEAALSDEGRTHADLKRFEAARDDLDEAIRLVRKERGFAVHYETAYV